MIDTNFLEEVIKNSKPELKVYHEISLVDKFQV